MKSIFEKLQAVDAALNYALINAYNHHVARQNPKYRLIVNAQVRPCFFSGDIETRARWPRSASIQPTHRR